MSLPDFSKMTIPRLAVFAAERFGQASAIEEGAVRLSFADLADRRLARDARLHGSRRQAR